MQRFTSIIFFVLLGATTSLGAPVPDEDGYLPVDYDDPDYFHVSEYDDDLPSGRLFAACVSPAITKDPVDIVEKELRLGAYPDVIHQMTLRPILHECTIKNFTKSVRLLVERGASLVKTDPDGWNTCHKAAFVGIVDVMRLCHEKGVDLMTNSAGAQYHYLNYACSGDKPFNVETVRFLLEIGVDPDIRSDIEGLSCMEEYAEFQPIRDLLVEFGAKTKKKPKRKPVHDDL